MEQEEKNALAAKRLKYYLREYWVQPPKTDFLAKTFKDFVHSKTQFTFSVIEPDPIGRRQIGQQAILAFNRSVYWDSVEAYTLVESYLQGEPVQTNYSEPEFLIILVGVNNTPNKMLIPLVNGLIAAREVKNLKTLVISVKANSELVPVPSPLRTLKTKNEVI